MKRTTIFLVLLAVASVALAAGASFAQVGYTPNKDGGRIVHIDGEITDRTLQMMREFMSRRGEIVSRLLED